MHPQDAARVRASAQQGNAIDEVAKWYFDLLLAMEVSERKRLPGFLISPETVPGARLTIQGHHQKLAAFYRHGLKDGRLIGCIECCHVSRDGAVGESILEIIVTECGISFPDDVFIGHHVVEQPNYEDVRLATGYRIMAAIQSRMHC